MHAQQGVPDISLIRRAGEVTLLIDRVQAMQGWERELMWRSADLLCVRGGDFLEVGLGLGYSALRIAAHLGTRRHTVVEKYAEVIALFHAHNPSPPPNLEIIRADFFDVVGSLEPESLDGVFFDPELPKELFHDRVQLDSFMPTVVRALRPNGTFVPMFSLEGDVPETATCTAPVTIMIDRYLRYFDNVVIERHPYTAYADTRYTPARTGDAFILCFRRA